MADEGPSKTAAADERVLTALAHPLRRRLLDLLAVDGPATVSVLAERTEQAVGNASHHLKVLEAAGLIEEAPELARSGRERWWRRRPRGLRWSAGDAGSDPTAAAVATAAEGINLERQLELLRRWLAERDASGEAWERAAFSTDDWLRLSPDELTAFAAELNQLVRRWTQPRSDDVPGRRPVFVFARAFPARP